MKNVFLIGNGFDSHHMLPTKYFDFMCVTEYLKQSLLVFPITIGKVFSECKSNTNICRCYDAHKEVFDSKTIESKHITNLLQLVENNIWFNYFSKTLNRDLGWIDFEKEISTVLCTLDRIITLDESTVDLPQHELLPPFILSNFRFFVDINNGAEIFPGEDFDIKPQYLREYPHNSGIFVADKKEIFKTLFEQLLDFSRALNIYFDCFVENTFDLLHKDSYTNRHRIELVNKADTVISFNYTSTLEKFYFNKTAYHIHGTIKTGQIVLGVNPSESDDIGTEDTSLLKFKKYYQREAYGTDTDYINWYRENISTHSEYRLVVIGHSLDETDKDIISDMFLNAKEIYVTYYDDDCKDSYIANIVRMFGKTGFDTFRRDQKMQFIKLSDIGTLEEKFKPVEIEWHVSDNMSGEIGEKIIPV